MAQTQRERTKQRKIHRARRQSSIANPAKLQPFTQRAEEYTPELAESGDDYIQVIIETPKGCRNKYSFDLKQKIFVLKRSLPAGMSFPYDFGFIPQTIAQDGDPVDVLVLMDEAAFPGCALMARLIGVIEGEQIDGKQTTRNDRLVAVAATAHMYANLRKLKDLPEQSLREIEQFFVNYHQLQGKEYKLLGCRGKNTAFKLIANARKPA